MSATMVPCFQSISVASFAISLSALAPVRIARVEAAMAAMSSPETSHLLRKTLLLMAGRSSLKFLACSLIRVRFSAQNKHHAEACATDAQFILLRCLRSRARDFQR